MFKLFAAVILALSLATACATVTYPRLSPTFLTESVARSIVKITGFGGHVCSGFVIFRDHVLTDHHCLGENLKVDSYEATVIKIDPYYDLALLRVANIGKNALTFRDIPVEKFEEVVGIGYANGWNSVTTVKETVIQVNQAVEPNGAVGIIVYGGYINGMSGGPVVDKRGHVVGIIQRSVNNTGYGVGTLIIRAFLLGVN